MKKCSNEKNKFMDCQMPIIDVYRAAELSREFSEKDIPIIAMATNAMKDEEEKYSIIYKDIVVNIIKELNLTKDMAEELVLEFIEVVAKSLEDLRSSIDSKDYSELAKISHSIKGAASTLRIQELANSYFEIEKNAKIQNLEVCNSIIKDINKIYLKLNENINKRDLRGEKND